MLLTFRRPRTGRFSHNPVRFTALAGVLLALLGTVPPGRAAPPDDVALLDSGHPLAGRIWSVRERRFVSPAELERVARTARLLLLGERHGNPEHHRLQGRLLEAAGGDGRPVALVAEQLDFAAQPAIDACRRDCADFGAELGARVDWERSGWPPYARYVPVYAAAARVGAGVYAGNPGAARVRALARGAAAEPAEGWLARADRPLPARGRARLVADLVAGHCGQLAPAHAEPLVRAQRVRDAALAATLERVRPPDGVAVLVAGNGHVRRDYGVPRLLAEPAVVVAFMEVEPRATSPAAYGPGDAYDYLWFTARVDEPDPCQRFREQLERGMPGNGPARP
jgi:uncharacterized iron-regulated protein